VATLVTVYWLCFGVGLAWVLLAGALGAISHGFAGAHGGDSGGLDHDAHVGIGEGNAESDSTGFDAHASGIESSDINSDGHGEAQQHDAVHAGSADHGGSGMPDYNPFSILSIMGTLAGFGAGGLIGSNYPVGMAGTLACGAVGGVLMALALWLIIGKLLYSLHASSEAHVSDMIGLEAEVLTPVEHGMSGEIAYVLDGTRYTAPARLVHEGVALRSSKVRIRKVSENLVYVEEQRKLLA
jgi:hypothetical protein